MPPRGKGTSLRRTATARKASLYDGTDNVEETSTPPSKGRGPRTGQACDHCKKRKIRCDSDENGCENCKSANVACVVTDRNTGNAHRRDQLKLELDKQIAQNNYIEALERSLQENGVKLPKRPTNAGSVPWSAHREISAKLANFNAKLYGQNYLGAAGHPDLSLKLGTQMTLFDNHIDLDLYFPRSEDNSAFELLKSEYLQYVRHRVSAVIPEWPTRADAETLGEWYYGGVAFFTPVIDRSMFHKIMQKKYNRGSDNVTENETVIFHMIQATTCFQQAIRGLGDTLELARNARICLLYCLTQVDRLMEDDDLTAMQALTLMCVAMRALQRPGPAWSFCDRVITRAIEVGLHRSWDTWKEVPNRDAHFIEMRKRTFWTLMVVHVNLSGNFGRPMRLRYEDIDIEQPEIIPDTGQNCSWAPAKYGFELTEIQLQVYSNICSIRTSRPKDREATFGELLNNFERSLPPEFTGQRKDAHDVTYIAGCYLRLGLHATRLIVNHPRYLHSEAGMDVEHLSGLMATARKILAVAEALTEVSSLDTTVYYNMDFVYAAFVQLYVCASQARTRHIGQQEVDKVENDVRRWLAVFIAVGTVLGSDRALHDRMQEISTKILAQIRRELDVTRPDPLASNNPMSASLDLPLHQEHWTGMLDASMQYMPMQMDQQMSRDYPGMITPEDSVYGAYSGIADNLVPWQFQPPTPVFMTQQPDDYSQQRWTSQNYPEDQHIYKFEQ